MTGYEQQMYEAVPKMARSIESINKSLQSRQIDWEQRRYEIAKDVMTVQLSMAGFYCAEKVVDIAYKLIAELKKTAE